MSGLITGALTGLFVLSSAGGLSSDAWIKTQSREVPTYKSFSVAMTGYNAVPEQTDGDPFTTASGAFSDPDVVAARSVDLADELPFGTVIAVTAASSSPTCGFNVAEDAIGLRVVADSMHPRKRNQIDILFDVKPAGWRSNPAVTLGTCKGVQIRVVGFIDIDHMPHSQAELKIALGLPAPAGALYAGGQAGKATLAANK